MTPRLTIEELEQRQKEIKQRRQSLHKEYEGRRFSDEARHEWRAINEEYRANRGLIDELLERDAFVEDGDDPVDRVHVFPAGDVKEDALYIVLPVTTATFSMAATDHDERGPRVTVRLSLPVAREVARVLKEAADA